VLNATIKRNDAVAQLRSLIKELNIVVKKDSRIQPANPLWVFPLRGYKSNAIGGVKGSGYSDKGYNYLDGNKHTAHPAHDIFINDKNQDELDDRTLKTVDVLAVDKGVVIACNNKWEPASLIRGGKFIWLYHPGSGTVSYYAHSRTIFVKPGDYIRQGQKIAEVGRTGLNAYKKRSPTHLHYSTFNLAGGVPVPFNSYKQLLKSQKR
jgi:murein DD-endopeptidase MepM/ murein hydrolase activator NlpD